MPLLAAPVLAALVEARRQLAELYGDRLVRAVLYGSYARSEAGLQSDVDVLVVLRDPVADYPEIKRLAGMELELWERHGVDVHLMPFSAARYDDSADPFVRNVHPEAVDLSKIG